MAVLNHLKFMSDKKYFIFLTYILVFTFNVKASDYISESKSSEEPLIQNISYDYNLFYNDREMLDCNGTLKISLNLPENTFKLLVERSRPHLKDPDEVRRLLIVLSEYPVSSELIIPDKSWGTYFRVRVMLADYTNIYSSIYSINDYINPDDLEALLNPASIESVEVDEVYFQIQDKQLYVNSQTPVSLSIFDVYGKWIFNGEIDRMQAISLSNISSPFVIATYTILNKTYTKKIWIR